MICNKPNIKWVSMKKTFYVARAKTEFPVRFMIQWDTVCPRLVIQLGRFQIAKQQIHQFKNERGFVILRSKDCKKCVRLFMIWNQNKWIRSSWILRWANFSMRCKSTAVSIFSPGKGFNIHATSEAELSISVGSKRRLQIYGIIFWQATRITVLLMAIQRNERND